MLLDDQGHPVITPAGPRRGKPMLRPAGFDPHFFATQGKDDSQRLMADALTGDPSAFATDLLHDRTQLKKFVQAGEWDAQRIGGKQHPEFVDYATVLIGVYAAALGLSRGEILEIENYYAKSHSHILQ